MAYRIGDPVPRVPNPYDGYSMSYGGFEAPNGCAMDATWQAGTLTVNAHPPEWARPEFVADSEEWAHNASRFVVGWPKDANAHLHALGVKETVFSEECDGCGVGPFDGDCIYCGRRNA